MAELRSNHKWEKAPGKPVKGEIERRRCNKCGVQTRKIRKGSTKPKGGWIVLEIKKPGDSWDRTFFGEPQIPQCIFSVCPICKGAGRFKESK